MQSCDTFVVLAPAAAKNRVVFGKNADRPKGEVQEVRQFPAATHAAGSKLQCTYIEIDQVESTNAIVVSKPVWMWGAEMGANEHNVVIGNEAVFTKTDTEGVKEKKLIGMDLLRLGLERGKTAKEALEVITGLLEKYGQGGPCSQDGTLFYHNSFIIADNQEAYVLETANKYWVAEKVSSGFRNISNSLSIGSKFDLSSDGIKEKTQTEGLWDGSGDFDFAKIFDSDGPCPRYEAGKKLLEAQCSAEGNFTADEMMSILRDKQSGICRDVNEAHPTQSSQVSVLSKNGHSCHWFTGTPDPSISVFKPFIFTEGVTDSKHLSANENKSTALYELHQKAVHTEDLSNLLRDMEKRCITEIDQILDCGAKPEELRELFKDACETEMKFYK